MNDEPKPISDSTRRTRVRRIRQLCRELGFRGRVEYRHLRSQSGGAQFLLGESRRHDRIVVYAEGFDRDADPADFDLEAIVAHECGHCELIRNRQLRRVLQGMPHRGFEEILSSLVGSILLARSESAQTLVWKATIELAELGFAPDRTVYFIQRLRTLMRALL